MPSSMFEIMAISAVAALFYKKLWEVLKWHFVVTVPLVLSVAVTLISSAQRASWSGVSGLVNAIFYNYFSLATSTVTLIIFFAIAGFILSLFKSNDASGNVAAEAGESEIVRGARVVKASELDEMVKSAGEVCMYKIAGVTIPRSAEATHLLFCGTTGAGKTQAYHGVLKTVREEKHKAVVADVGGEMLARYYREGDIVLNPFDSRSVSWSPLAEMRGEWDAEKVAKSIVPDGHGSAAEWNGYAQKVVSAVLRKQWESGVGSNGEIVRLLTAASRDELAEYVAGLPAAGLFNENNKGMLGSIMGIVSTYISPISYLDKDAGEHSFSIRDYISSEENGNWLFINFTDSQLAALKPLISSFMDTAISALLELKPDSNRKIYFVIDEFSTFGMISSLLGFFEKARKYGGIAILGCQAFSQITESYGREKAQTILACLGTWLILRTPDPETADYMSRYLGDQEIKRTNTSTSAGRTAEGWSENSTQSIEHKTQRAVLPSDIQNLPSLSGFLNIAGDFPVATITVPIVHGDEVAERFIQRTGTQKPKKSDSTANASGQERSKIEESRNEEIDYEAAL